MPSLDTRIPGFTPNKKLKLDWKGWSGGWVNVFDDNELKPNELTKADNCLLKGRGVVAPRWGSDLYFKAGDSYVSLVDAYYMPEDDVNNLLAVTYDGYLVKKSGASSTMISGASFASGSAIDSAQLGGNTYFVGGGRELVKYDGTSLAVFATLSTPTGVGVSNVSGASGTAVYGWRIAAKSLTGSTLASETVSLTGLPQDLTETLVYVKWSAVSAASGVLTGYDIYRGQPGDETWIDSVGPDVTEYFDYGGPQSDTILPPKSNTTGGPKAKYVLKLDSRLVVAGFVDDPSLVMISGNYPYEGSFHWSDGGGYVRIAPDDGDEITGLAIVGSNTKGGTVPSTIVVFKRRSAYAMVLKTLAVGNYELLDPQFQQLLSVGTTSNKSVVPVENDVFFLSRDGFYSVGSEPNYLNEIRSKEISTRIRDYMDGLTDENFAEANAAYIDHKYICSFPSRKETIVYDYERRAWMGPWKTPFGITHWYKYYDEEGDEQWLAGADDGNVYYFNPGLTNDSGTAFKALATTRKEDFDDWTIMKILEMFYILMRNVKGTVNVTVRGEDRTGKTIGLKSFSIQGGSVGSAGYGTSLYGDAEWGDSEDEVNVTSEDFVRYSNIYKTIRVVQVEVSSSGAADYWEMINIKMDAQPQGRGSLSPNTRV